MKTILVVAVGVVLILGLLTVEKRRDDVAGLAWAEEDLKLGEKIYQENCAACHGDKGDGKGPQADRLSIKPRNFYHRYLQIPQQPIRLAASRPRHLSDY